MSAQLEARQGPDATSLRLQTINFVDGLRNKDELRPHYSKPRRSK